MAGRIMRPRTRDAVPDQYAKIGREVVRLLEAQIDRRGWDGATLMRRAGLVRSAISMWRRGKAVPTLASLYACARALGCSIHDLTPEK